MHVGFGLIADFAAVGHGVGGQHDRVAVFAANHWRKLQPDFFGQKWHQRMQQA